MRELMPHNSLALWPPHKKVDGRANQVSEDNYQYPDDFIIALRWLVGRAINDHPYPEDCAQNGYQAENAEKQEKKR